MVSTVIDRAQRTRSKGWLTKVMKALCFMEPAPTPVLDANRELATPCADPQPPHTALNSSANTSTQAATASAAVPLNLTPATSAVKAATRHLHGSDYAGPAPLSQLAEQSCIGRPPSPRAQPQPAALCLVTPEKQQLSATPGPQTSPTHLPTAPESPRHSSQAQLATPHCPALSLLGAMQSASHTHLEQDIGACLGSYSFLTGTEPDASLYPSACKLIDSLPALRTLRLAYQSEPDTPGSCGARARGLAHGAAAGEHEPSPAYQYQLEPATSSPVSNLQATGGGWHSPDSMASSSPLTLRELRAAIHLRLSASSATSHVAWDPTRPENGIERLASAIRICTGNSHTPLGDLQDYMRQHRAWLHGGEGGPAQDM